MKTVFDWDNFDSKQKRVLQELVKCVLQSLKNNGINDDELLKSLMEDIVFGICGIIDGSWSTTLNEEELIPVLGFVSSKPTQEILLSDSRYPGSWMHELAFGAIEDLLD